MIIVTGASKGIGKYLFEKYTEQGYRVYGTYNSTNVNCNDKYVQVDVTDYEAVHNWISLIKEELNEIVLINCAGISYNSFAHKADILSWHRVIDVNLKGTFNVIHNLLPTMREQNYGRIINFSSVVTKLPTQGISAYTASKAGLIGLTKSLAAENASKGITANAINLGYADLGMGIHDVPPQYQEIIKAKIPCKRFCSPEEILNTINYIIATEYVNGACIDINGGII
jgi:acetoacetyl-CoA reductase/3-oxoacyl-[acyl-carrier protein] reductase